mgnify:CR=1 FL=1
MKIYVDAIEDEYPYIIYASINDFVSKDEQQLFIGPIFVTYQQLKFDFINTWQMLVEEVDIPNDSQSFAFMMRQYTTLANALAEFVSDIDNYYFLEAYAQHNMSLHDEVEDQELDPDPDPEITTLAEIESSPPSRMRGPTPA